MSETQTRDAASADTDAAPHRYTSALAAEIERRWQDHWESEGTFEAPNPTGPLAGDVQGREKFFLMDMFPYPSGEGLHVGHPLGYIATDVLGRYKRMCGINVLHALSYDAFGLPAEQYAVQTGQHPRITTEANMANMRRQLRRLGLAHDRRRSFATTDPGYVRWTQWIFLQIFESWYDHEAADGRGRARPIAELVAEYESGRRPTPDGRAWSELGELERRRVVDAQRLAYVSDAPVNWSPGLGTVLANEEVTSDGRSERGNFPVFKRSLRQWMLRITAYADRLIDDLDRIEWPDKVKTMQRNWIGRSAGATVTFPITTANGDHHALEVFTTRPDTLFGTTFMVVAPEHPMLDALTASAWPDDTKDAWTGGHAKPAEAVAAYRAAAAAKTEVERQTEGREKTGVFTGSFAVNPANGQNIPVFVADYVLMGYGTGAIMAVPGQDERDWEFAERFDLPIVRTVAPPEGWAGEAYLGDGPAINSANDEISLNGLGVADAKTAIIGWLEAKGLGEGTVTYRLRDWLFSRQRYWGEPFPIVYDEHDLPVAVPDSMLPVELPDVPDYSPKTFAPDDTESEPEPPLARVPEWVELELDLGDGPKRFRRDTNTMPNWAGSCWYELRYVDPTNAERLVDPLNERYWMGPRSPGDPGGVDFYVGGVEHAVLHLLYARFWHKILFDLGHICSEEPFYKLFNQGYIQAYAYIDERGQYVPADRVVETGDGDYAYDGKAVNREYGKMGKSLKNVVSPDDMYEAYGADTLRVYEMSMGPLDVSRPWETRAVVGSLRFLQRLWRNVLSEETGKPVVGDGKPDDATLKVMHRTIDAVRTDMEALRFNTAIARLIELNNHATKLVTVPREVAEVMISADGAVRPARRGGAVVATGPRAVARIRAVPGRGPRLSGGGDGHLRGASGGQGAGQARGAAVGRRGHAARAGSGLACRAAGAGRAGRADRRRPGADAGQRRPGVSRPAPGTLPAMGRDVAIVTDSTAYLDAGRTVRHRHRRRARSRWSSTGAPSTKARLWAPPRSLMRCGDGSGSAPPGRARGRSSTPTRPPPPGGASAVVSVHISGLLSGTADAARLAARDAPVPVEVVDSQSLGMGLGFAVLAAVEAADRGLAVDEIAEVARQRAQRSSCFFYVDTLEYLRRGGRIGPAAALLGTALAVKPLLHLAQGQILPLEKVRTSSRAVARLEELALQRAGRTRVDVAVHHLDNAARAEALASRLQARVPALGQLVVAEVGAVIGAHVGPGLLGVVVCPR